MLKQLQAYIKNKKTIEGKERQILGSDATLKQFASFWEQHGDDLMMVTAINLHDWEHERTFDKAQLEAFREGIAVMGVFFRDCWIAVAKEEEKAKLENKKQEV